MWDHFGFHTAVDRNWVSNQFDLRRLLNSIKIAVTINWEQWSPGTRETFKYINISSTN